MDYIKTLKDFYGIGREALHLISGISADALMRYEKGEEAPRKYRMLLNAMLDIPTFETFFHLSKGLLNASDIDKIEKKIVEEMKWRERQVREYRKESMNVG